MKQTLKTILGSIVFLYASLILHAQELKVKVMQNQKEITSEKNVYMLNKAPFSFQIQSIGIEGLLVGATLDEDLYRSALGEGDLEITWFENTGMAESSFNDKQRMFISNDAPSYWYYTSKKDHRFDKTPTGTSENWNAERTISVLELLESDEQIACKNMERPLYVIFYTNVYDEDYNITEIIIHFDAEIKWKATE
ncbi:hypothetical protein [Paenimyroides ceti]